MADNQKSRDLKYINLRNTQDLIAAHEWLFNRQKDGLIDSKTADALNTTLKGSVYLNVKLRIDAAKIYIQASIKKIEIPDGMLPELGTGGWNLKA